MYSLRGDSKLSIICQEITENLPAKSVFICGSRATGRGVTDSSDYDVGVVMNTFLIPFYWRKMKRLERRLSQNFNSNLVINPLPTFRLNRARGNLFLFKLKKEGTTLYGQDLLQVLNPGNVEDISHYWYFSYLFSAIRELICSFDPELIITGPDKEKGKVPVREVAKAILHCGEIHLLINKHYEVEPDDMVLGLHQFNLQGMDQPQFLEDLHLAVSIRKGEVGEIQDPLGFWFRTRGYLLSTFRILMWSHYGSDDSDIKELAIKYFEAGRGAKLKDFQYFTLTLLARKGIFWRSLITRCSVEKRVWLAQLWLLLSVNQGEYIDKECLLQGYSMLRSYTTIYYAEDEIVLWQHLRKSIMGYYPLACTVMGV